MPGINDGFVGQGEEFVLNGVHENVVISAGEIPTPDTHVKEHITTEKDVLFRGIKGYTSRGMAGSVEDPEVSFADFYHISFLKVQIRRRT